MKSAIFSLGLILIACNPDTAPGTGGNGGEGGTGGQPVITQPCVFDQEECGGAFVLSGGSNSSDGKSCKTGVCKMGQCCNLP